MRKFICTFFLLISFSPLYASHIVGGDISYDYLGGNVYRFYVSVYRDNLSGGAMFDTPLQFSVFRISDNSRFGDYQFNYTGFSNVPINFNNPCGTAPSNIDTQNAIYIQNITLPPTPGGYRVAYQRCCRGPNINNLFQPDDTGLTLTIDVPGVANNNYVNSSPDFTNYPPLVLCSNDDLVFDHSATDVDGDDLVYSLVTPYAGGNSMNPAPNPIPAPNYPLVVWANGFSATQALGPSASISINPVTGIINAFPTTTGRYVVGIQVQEFRNGVLISTTIRDFIFQVFNCNIVLQAELPDQEDLASFTGFCDGNLQIQFENNSFGASNYHWDFGVNGVTTDVSTDFEPVFSYPDTGTYIVQLIANPGFACTDTTYMEIYLYDEINIAFDAIDTLCFTGNSIDFTAITDAPSGADFDWSFAPDGNPLQSTNRDPQNITFGSSGWKYIEVTAEFSVCEASYIDSIYIIPKPIADFEMPINYQCDGLLINFSNTSLNSDEYIWDFGFNNQTSTDFEPSINFPAGGSYDVQLVSNKEGSCPDSITKTLNVNELMVVSFTSEDDQCIVGNNYNFIGQVAGPNHATFTWDFGPNANVSSTTDTSVYNVAFTAPGAYTVTLTGAFDECEEIASKDIYIFAQPTIDFSLVDGLQCVPWTAQFIDQCTSETPIYYSWNFGDGSPISTDSDPAHVYDTPGMYVVTLTIRTDEGCIDTLILEQEDLINIFPIPEAAFDVSTEETDICHPSVYFTNQSSDASKYYYWLDDGATYRTQENFGYAFSSSGYHYPYLIAYNEEGCSDTANVRIYVEPFSVFIPNTFTPDDDQFNGTLTPQMWLTPTEWDFKIYNRWGEIVFKTTDYNEGWDGIYKGVPAQTGTYQYILTYKPCSAEQGTVFVEGHINLLR